MNQYKLNVLFVIDKSKPNKKGLCYIKCRITFIKNRKEFSTGLFINPSYWNSQNQTVHYDSVNNNYINTQLSLIRQKLHQAFYFYKFRK